MSDLKKSSVQPLPEKWSESTQRLVLLGFYGFMAGAVAIVVLCLIFMEGATKPIKNVPFSNLTQLTVAVDQYVASGSTANTSKYGANMSAWNVSAVSDFSYLFSGRRNPAMTAWNGNISAWNVKNASAMVGMFSGNQAFNGNLSKWNVSKVADMSEMFDGASNFSGVGLDMWSTDSLANLKATFNDAIMFDADLSNWTTSKVTNMKKTFYNASSLQGFGVGRWNTSSVTDLRYTFGKALLMDDDLADWDTSSALSMTSMFEGADAFQGRGVELWSTMSCTEMDWVFANTAMFNADLSSWDVAAVTTFNAMFYNTSAYSGLGINNWAVSSTATMDGMFCNATGKNPFVSPSWLQASADCTGVFTWGDEFDHLNK